MSISYVETQRTGCIARQPAIPVPKVLGRRDAVQAVRQVIDSDSYLSPRSPESVTLVRRLGVRIPFNLAWKAIMVVAWLWKLIALKSTGPRKARRRAGHPRGNRAKPRV